jgi:hypothetical protein
MIPALRTPAARRPRVARAAGLAVLASLAAFPASAGAAGPYPSDTAKPDLVPLLQGYDRLWTPSGANDLHGTVRDAATLSRNDELATWINVHATKEQQFRALQDSEYDDAAGTHYDQSSTIADALGSQLGPIYLRGRRSGALPLTTALINSSNGTTGAYVSTGAAKARFSHPRPYLPSDPDATPVAGDDPGCAPSTVNASSRRDQRVGRAYADENGSLLIRRVPDAVDSTHRFSPNDVPLSAGYGTTGICTGGSFPSGHTTTAYQAGITLATLLPELAPEVLARASEAGNDRIVLGVHYPLDVVGGRIAGEAAVATRWADPAFRTEVLEPARRELVGYLEETCGGTLARCIADQSPYEDDPYGGRAIPGGTPQVVTDRASALAVYRERLTYGIAPTGPVDRDPAVPPTAQALLLTTFPTLSDAQRTSVLAQTSLPSGSPLDGTGTAEGSWQRLDLAAAQTATVRANADGSVTVTSTGGRPTGVAAPPTPAPPAATPPTTAPSTPVAPPKPSSPAPGGSTTPAKPVDTRRPVLGGLRRTCTRTRCVVTVTVTDPAPSSGIARVRGRLTWTIRSGRRTTRHTRTLTGRSLSGGRYRLVASGLGRRSYALTITTVDRDGHAQRRALHATLRPWP